LSARLAEAAAQDAAHAEAAPSGAKTVLVAPSWGENAILRRYGRALLEPLAASSYRVIIRPHPQSLIVERELVENLRAALAAYPSVEWNFDADNLSVLSQADVLISDFSGVVFDYAFLFARPVIYPSFEFDKRPYDLADIPDEAWVFRAIRELGAPLNAADFGRIGAVLDAAIAASAEKTAALRRLTSEAWMHQTEAGARVVDALEAALN
jgi:CDP-glycerol glycerophosphotransferase (TagB/SpsB family)